jgi:hypothetical protein
MSRIFNTVLFMIGLLVGSPATACKPIVAAKLDFADGTAELDPEALAKLAEFVHRANATYPVYLGVSIDGGATVKAPSGTPEAARRLAERRAANAARAYLQFQPRKLKLEIGSEIFADDHLSKVASNDYVVVQFHIDYAASKVPDCNPVPIPGFKR